MDAVLLLQHNVSAGLVVRPGVIRRHLDDELPFMATETILMHAVRRGGDRQDLHERIRRHSVAAAERVKDEGEHNDLIERIVGDAEFALTRPEIEGMLDPARFTGRAAEQVDNFLKNEVEPVLRRQETQERVPELRA
jgi:adenylosuccinate lyase